MNIAAQTFIYILLYIPISYGSELTSKNSGLITWITQRFMETTLMDYYIDTGQHRQAYSPRELEIDDYKVIVEGEDSAKLPDRNLDLDSLISDTIFQFSQSQNRLIVGDLYDVTEDDDGDIEANADVFHDAQEYVGREADEDPVKHPSESLSFMIRQSAVDAVLSIGFDYAFGRRIMNRALNERLQQEYSAQFRYFYPNFGALLSRICGKIRRLGRESQDSGAICGNDPKLILTANEVAQFTLFAIDLDFAEPAYRNFEFASGGLNVHLSRFSIKLSAAYRIRIVGRPLFSGTLHLIIDDVDVKTGVAMEFHELPDDQYWDDSSPLRHTPVIQQLHDTVVEHSRARAKGTGIMGMLLANGFLIAEYVKPLIASLLTWYISSSLSGRRLDELHGVSRDFLVELDETLESQWGPKMETHKMVRLHDTSLDFQRGSMVLSMDVLMNLPARPPPYDSEDFVAPKGSGWSRQMAFYEDELVEEDGITTDSTRTTSRDSKASRWHKLIRFGRQKENSPIKSSNPLDEAATAPELLDERITDSPEKDSHATIWEKLKKFLGLPIRKKIDH